MTTSGASVMRTTALRDGAVDAACMVDSNLLLFAQEGTLVAGSIRVVATTDPYDHCNMTSGPAADLAQIDRFVELLLAMSYSDVEVRRLLDLEGLKQWLPGRTEGLCVAGEGCRRDWLLHVGGRR